MDANLLRLKHLADGWKGSNAPVTLNAADAELLGFPLDTTRSEEDGSESVGSHATVKGKDLYDRVVKAIRSGDSPPAASPKQATPAGPTNQGSGDGLDEKKVAELREIASFEGITLQATTKAEMVGEIRAARKAKAGQ